MYTWRIHFAVRQKHFKNTAFLKQLYYNTKKEFSAIFSHKEKGQEEF